MTTRILVLQEKPENMANIKAALADCELAHVRTIEQAIPTLAKQRFDLIISAVHLEYDGSVFDFLRLAKGSPATKHIPFIFYCSQSSKFARSVRDGLQIAARALGADKYITMETYELKQLRKELLEYLPEIDSSPFWLSSHARDTDKVWCAG